MDNQSRDNMHSAELPSPTVDNFPVPQETGFQSPNTEVDAARSVEQGNPITLPPGIMPPVASSVPTTDFNSAIPPTAVSSNNPSIADDSDLIEKEWVDKAKQIVARTKDDPHSQNKELTHMKADYLKKRYNKDIKLEEV